jgi:hypothetical protein
MPRLQWPAALICMAGGGSWKRIGTLRPELRSVRAASMLPSWSVTSRRVGKRSISRPSGPRRTNRPSQQPPFTSSNLWRGGALNVMAGRGRDFTMAGTNTQARSGGRGLPERGPEIGPVRSERIRAGGLKGSGVARQAEKSDHRR